MIATQVRRGAVNHVDETSWHKNGLLMLTPSNAISEDKNQIRLGSLNTEIGHPVITYKSPYFLLDTPQVLCYSFQRLGFSRCRIAKTL
jgi:hypothetical protein